MALYGLAGLEIRGLSHASLHRCRLAPQRLSVVLDLEDSTWETRTTGRAQTSARLDSNDEPRKSSLGRLHAFMVSGSNSASRLARPALVNIWSVIGSHHHRGGVLSSRII